jgi:hypothetical protein
MVERMSMSKQESGSCPAREPDGSTRPPADGISYPFPSAWPAGPK